MCQFIICNKLITHIFLIILLIINFYYSIEVFFFKLFFQNTYISNLCACLTRNQTIFVFICFYVSELQNLVNTITFLLKFIFQLSQNNLWPAEYMNVLSQVIMWYTNIFLFFLRFFFFFLFSYGNSNISAWCHV